MRYLYARQALRAAAGRRLIRDSGRRHTFRFGRFSHSRSRLFHMGIGDALAPATQDDSADDDAIFDACIAHCQEAAIMPPVRASAARAHIIMARFSTTGYILPIDAVELGSPAVSLHACAAFLARPIFAAIRFSVHYDATRDCRRLPPSRRKYAGFDASVPTYRDDADFLKRHIGA